MPRPVWQPAESVTFNKFKTARQLYAMYNDLDHVLDWTAAITGSTALKTDHQQIPEPFLGLWEMQQICRVIVELLECYIVFDLGECLGFLGHGYQVQVFLILLDPYLSK